jgi:hypothetical protein
MKNKNGIRTRYNAKLRDLRSTVRSTLLRLALGLGIAAVLMRRFAPSTRKPIRDPFTKTVQEGLQRGREGIEPVGKRLESDLVELPKHVEERIHHTT